MSLFKTLKFITSHPLNRKRNWRGIGDFIWWQTISRLIGSPILYNLVNEKYIITQKGLSGVTGNIYCGLHEYEDMAFVLHYLRPEDLFADIGANVGSYTVLAGSTGASAIAVEPIPSTFRILQSNIGVNQFKGEVYALNIGLAALPGELFFTNSMDTVNHVVPSGTPNSQVVQVNTLNTIFSDRPPSLIKMDVEGFELEVLKGGSEILRSPLLEAIVIELNDSGRKYGALESDIIRLLNEAGFVRKTYDPQRRLLHPYSGNSTTGNGLFVRNSENIQSRLTQSEKYKIRELYL